MSSSTILRRTVVIATEHGLHIRPCAVLAQVAQKFQSEIRLVRGTVSADAKRVLDLLTLGAGAGSTLDLEVVGEDATDAFQEVSRLFDTNFSSEFGAPENSQDGE